MTGDILSEGLRLGEVRGRGPSNGTGGNDGGGDEGSRRMEMEYNRHSTYLLSDWVRVRERDNLERRQTGEQVTLQCRSPAGSSHLRLFQLVTHET